MKAKTPLFWSGSTDMDDWVPFQYQYEQDGEMVDFGEVVLMRTEGSSGKPLFVGIWRYDKVGSIYFSSDGGDETFHLLEGELEIEVIATGERHHYKAGDICSWTKSTPTMWHVKAPLKKVFVIAGT